MQTMYKGKIDFRRVLRLGRKTIFLIGENLVCKKYTLSAVRAFAII